MSVLPQTGLSNGTYDAVHHDTRMASQAAPQKTQNKPLRFVTNYGAPTPKRRRIAAACLTCRKRKTACSGERPTCETCQQNRLECAGYASEAAPPGHKRSTSDSNGKANADAENDEDERPRKVPVQNTEHLQDIDPTLQDNNNFAMPSLPYTWSNSSIGGGNGHGKGNGTSGNAGAINGGVQQTTEPAATGEESTSSLFSGSRNRMPYFRWLGPTAIMPGFKQMVVKVKRQDGERALSSTDGVTAAGNMRSSPLKSYSSTLSDHQGPAASAAAAESEARAQLNLPFYDHSPMPPSELITHLANTFFTHLGCNYPFLQRERFMRDLEEKQVDAILVDAVCALAARFSKHELLTQQTSDESKTSPAEYGHAFAQRAQTALVDVFPCPTVAAVQAALLLAYNEFGENRDSGLWMYLGISIRMAQDLGLHKIEGLKYRGKTGPTPKMIKRESMSGSPELQTKLVSGKREKDEAVEKAAREKVLKEACEGMIDAKDQAEEQKEIDERKAVEQERVDTFWAVFFLDRVVSSGTGRRSTLRDKDIELSLPALESTDPKTGWPAPFPALIRIVHLYGRVADLLNSIKEPGDITSETPKRMASMESQVTNFYQGLSPRLHFDAVNFQHYMKAGEGTNFVLLHFWFHTLIVLLHQPTLLKTFEGRMLQLFPNSQQLSMSSAKTIADILSYSQLMDAKASLGNPFTTQPIYIAACAFLKETAEQTATSNAQSRDSSPSRSSGKKDRPPSTNGTPTQRKRISISDLSNHSDPTSSPVANKSASSMSVDQHKSSDRSEHSGLSAAKTASALAKHTLLATAASQHYQLCYKALESLHTYWAGTKYILTVLDQKFEGVRDPLLYTVEESESAMEQPRPEPAFTSPGWRRKLSWGPYLYGANVRGADFWREKAGGVMRGSPAGGDPHKAIGWTLTGTMNSPNLNLAWHYPSETSPTSHDHQQQSQPAAGVGNIDPTSPDLNKSAQLLASHPLPAPPSNSHQQPPSLNTYSTDDATFTHPSADFPLSMTSPFNQTTNTAGNTPHDAYALQHTTSNTSHHDTFSTDPNREGMHTNTWNYDNALWNWNHAGGSSMQTPFGDMMIESQDVDMSLLGLDMMPWFDPTNELAGYFDERGQLVQGEHHGGQEGGSGEQG